jgi:hypothetical protein
MDHLPLTSEPTRITIRRIGLRPFVKWYALAFVVLGAFMGALCTAWYILDGQLKGKAIIWYFIATVFWYAVPGLLGSIVFAVIYNSLAAKFGGLQFDIVAENKTLPPAPSERWEGTLPKIEIPDT